MADYAEGTSGGDTGILLPSLWDSQPAAACGCCVPGYPANGGKCGVLDESKCPTGGATGGYNEVCCSDTFRTNCGDSLVCIMFDHWCSRVGPFLIFLVALALGCVYFFMKHRATRGAGTEMQTLQILARGG